MIQVGKGKSIENGNGNVSSQWSDKGVVYTPPEKKQAVTARQSITGVHTHFFLFLAQTKMSWRSLLTLQYWG